MCFLRWILNFEIWFISTIVLNMVVKLAFIQFKSDRVYDVVSIDDISKFLPKHCDDFVKGEVYKAKWPYLKDSSSFSEADYHDAFILCLGGKKNQIPFQYLPVLFQFFSFPPNLHLIIPRAFVSEALKPRDAKNTEVR